MLIGGYGSRMLNGNGNLSILTQREKVIKKITDVKWYEFWDNRSGFMGGLIFGVVVGYPILFLLGCIIY